MVLKKVYYPQVGIHTYMQALINNPPRGYEFITLENSQKKKFISSIKKSSFAVWIYTKIIKKTFNVFNIINKFYYQPSPIDTDLILSTGPMVTDEKPWIMKILDTPFSLGGNDYNVFLKNLKEIESKLLSPYCKAIIVHTKKCFEHMEEYFSKDLMKKVTILTPAIPGEIVERPKRDIDKGLTFLFLGSINNPDEFLMKGGLEALESFKKIHLKYPETRLIMRCKVPSHIRERYQSLEGVEFIEQRVSIEELKQIYLRADALLMPGYGYFIMAFLEAFQHGLPIISLDTYGVSEFVVPNKTGFYTFPSERVPTKVKEYPSNVRSKDFADKVEDVDEKVIESLSNYLDKIINDRNLLEKMSKECQKEFKEKYSYETKIKKLKKIFDSSLV